MGNSPCFHFLSPRPKLTFGYWDFRGLGAPMRMMSVYAGADWEDVKYAAKKKTKGGWVAKEWEREARPVLKERNALVNLPYVINHLSGEVVSQSNAVSLYLGRLFGLNGATREEQLANEQVLFHIHGMWMEHRDLVYPNKGSGETEFLEALPSHFKDKLPSNYEKLESWLGQRGTAFIAGNEPCTADFHLWEMLDQQEALAKRNGFQSPVADFEMMQAYFWRFRSIPKLKPYFDSPDFRLPFQGLMAFFR